MELRQLEYVIAVAETGTFTAAAERCYVVQSGLSHQIGRLEEELGTRLFDRTSRGVRPTGVGETFVACARQILAQVDQARSEASGHAGVVRGRLDIGTIQTLPPQLDLPHLLLQFHQQHPDVEITLLEGVTDNLLVQTQRRALDCAFVALHEDEHPTGMDYQHIHREALVAISAAGHPLAHCSDVDLERLAEEVFIDFAPGSGLRTQTDRVFREAGLTRRIRFTVTSIDSLADLTATGLAITLVPESTAQALIQRRHPRHHVLPIRNGPTRTTYLVCTPHPSYVTVAFAALVAICLQHTPANPPASPDPP